MIKDANTRFVFTLFAFFTRMKMVWIDLLVDTCLDTDVILHPCACLSAWRVLPGRQLPCYTGYALTRSCLDLNHLPPYRPSLFLTLSFSLSLSLISLFVWFILISHFTSFSLSLSFRVVVVDRR